MLCIYLLKKYYFQEIPPYNGFGSLEDSLQNCLRLQPERPKKDYVKLMENDHRVLRYEAVFGMEKFFVFSEWKISFLFCRIVLVKMINYVNSS